jgi:hypothetical protein
LAKAYAERRGDGQFPWRACWPSTRRSPKTGKVLYDHASGFATQDDALEYAEKQMARITLGIYTDPRGAKTPVGEWADKVMQAAHMSPATAEKRRRHLRLFILPRFEFAGIGEVNRWAVRTWAPTIPLVPDSVGQVVTTLSWLLTTAVDAGLIDANPIHGMRLSFAGQQQQSLVRREQRVWALPEASMPIAGRLATNDQKLMVVTAGFVGNRFGELAGLHADNCCLLRRDEIGGKIRLRYVIRVDPDVGALHETSELDGEGRERTRLWLGPPKPPNGGREVDVPEPLARFLIAHAAFARQRTADLDDDDPRKGLMFLTPGGALWRRSNWMRRIRPACDGRKASPKRPGTPGWPEWEPLVPGLDLRGLRIGHKTAMQEDGVAEVLQDATMGHGPARKQQEKDMGKRYTEITPQMRWHRLDALCARWERAGGIDLEAAA